MGRRSGGVETPTEEDRGGEFGEASPAGLAAVKASLSKSSEPADRGRINCVNLRERRRDPDVGVPGLAVSSLPARPSSGVLGGGILSVAG